MPAWIRCTCGNFWCTIHNLHAYDCPCPPIEEWDTDPYSGDPPMPTMTRRNYTVSEETDSQLTDLAQWWGGVEPLSAAGVIRYAVDLAWRLETEKRAGKKTSRKSRDEG